MDVFRSVGDGLAFALDEEVCSYAFRSIATDVEGGAYCLEIL